MYKHGQGNNGKSFEHRATSFLGVIPTDILNQIALRLPLVDVIALATDPSVHFPIKCETIESIKQFARTAQVDIDHLMFRSEHTLLGAAYASDTRTVQLLLAAGVGSDGDCVHIMQALWRNVN